MVSTRSTTTKDNTSNDDASDNNNNNINETENINEVERDNNNITTATTTNTEIITMTTTTETIADETQKKSNEFYIRSHQVMGTDVQVTSVTDDLAHNPSGENLFSRLSPLPNLNASDNLSDTDNLQSSVHNPSGENLNSRLSPLPNLNTSDNLNDEENLQSTVLSKTKPSLTETTNDGENLKSRVSPAPISTNITVHETDPKQSIVDTAHKSSKCSSTSQNQISRDQQATNVETLHTVTDVTGVSTNIENISVPPLFDTETTNSEQPLTENPTDMSTVLVEINTVTKSKTKKRNPTPKKNVTAEKHSEVITVDDKNSTAEQVSAENLGNQSTIAVQTGTPTQIKDTNKKQSPKKNTEISPPTTSTTKQVSTENLGNPSPPALQKATPTTRGRTRKQSSQKKIQISTLTVSTAEQMSAENLNEPSTEVLQATTPTSTKTKSKQKTSPQKNIKVSIPTELPNPNKAFFRNLVTDYSLPMNLLQIALFLQSTDNTVICQPQVNYRPLSISNIKTKRFIENMEGTTGDLNEEMHVILYEVTNVETPGRTVPIYSVYTTDEESITGKQETLIYAQQPSLVELYKLAKIIQPDKQWNLDPPVNRPVTADDIEKVFCTDRVKDLYTESTYFYHQSNVGLVRQQRKPKNTAQIQAAFATEKSSFQKTHRIRFAIIGGLHRVALAAHMFGNYVLDNKRPTKAPSNTYNFNGKSVLNSVLAVHLCIPHDRKLDETFVSHCREYSCIVQNRKSESFGPTIKSEMYLLLTSLSKPETNFKRHINSTFWTNDQVSLTA